MTFSVILVPNDEGQPLETHRVSWDDDEDPDKFDRFKQDILRILGQQDYLETPLIRPRGNNDTSVAGLYAYYNVPEQKQGQQNIRATRLAMACGLMSLRFYGPVLLVRSFGGRWGNLLESEIYGACCISPDLRSCIQESVARSRMIMAGTTNTIENKVPDWLADAAQQNYHDGAELQKVISAMNHPSEDATSEDEDGTTNEEDEEEDADNDEDENETVTHPSAAPATPMSSPTTEFVAKSPLCIHCRRLSSELCKSCEGVYFCPEETNHRRRSCREEGWSHACLCPTWELYSGLHRQKLSRFEDDYFGEWQAALTSRPHQLGEQPYEEYLRSLGIFDTPENCSSWWRTEMGGWSGGKSASASQVDASVRQSYAEGFAPIVDIPPERRVTEEDLVRSGQQNKKNSVGLLAISSWQEYYRLRNIPPSSPVCLLCTFPLTIYRAIEQFGEVPVTVSRMLKRPLRIHVVGAEKEMNFLDLFKELVFLLPEDLALELVFVVREDMLPAKCQATSSSSASSSGGGKFSMKMEFETMVVGVVIGTYGGATSLDPNFDCGTGPPDMVVALNAGLYAYESWRSVVNYLYYNKGVVGVFSDYNEYSGVNCAALGGSKSRESLSMNPFRQPRAMPVYSMNLPQFSNGFLYVFNEQELE